MTITVIIPTIGRPTLTRAIASVFPQLEPGDEVMVLRDATGDWGASARTDMMGRARGEYLAFVDDDDIMTPTALACIRRAIKEQPNRPHLFRLARNLCCDILPPARILERGYVSTQMLVCPNVSDLLGKWGSHYAGDFDFIASTIALYPPDSLVWNEEVIGVWRPDCVTPI